MTDAVLTRIAAEVGTPVFVYSADAVRERFEVLRTSLSDVPHRIHYAVKANSNLAVLGILKKLGAGADIVSVGELHRVLEVGFTPDHVVFSGVGKSRSELEEAVHHRVGLVNLESVEELDVLIDAAGDQPVALGIRVNPDITTDTHPYTQTGEGGMKFGVPLDQVVSLARAINDRPNITLTCIGMHIGSQISDAESYARGAKRLQAVLCDLRAADVVSTVTFLDLGGGLGIQYTDEKPIDIEAYGRVVADVHRATGLEVLVEPGRFLVGNAGVLLTSVLYRKHAGGRDFVIVDGGMNDFLRPALYRASHEVYVVGHSGEPEAGVVDIVGPICESGDFLALRHDLPPVGPGGLVAIKGAGAYGSVMSSNYNSRPRAAEVMVDGGRFGVVRERERIEHQWVDEKAEPAWIEST